MLLVEATSNTLTVGDLHPIDLAGESVKVLCKHTARSFEKLLCVEEARKNVARFDEFVAHWKLIVFRC